MSFWDTLESFHCVAINNSMFYSGVTDSTDSPGEVIASTIICADNPQNVCVTTSYLVVFCIDKACIKEFIQSGLVIGTGY